MGKTAKHNKLKYAVFISDTHCGCQFGLCPESIQLDNGAIYNASTLQKKLKSFWDIFWQEKVPEITRGEPYLIAHLGDGIDGSHHNSVHQITHNIEDQVRIAEAMLKPVVNNPHCASYIHIRGTEAHVGSSGQDEERLARNLGAIPDEVGNHARYDAWLRFSEENYLLNLSHHIGTTSSASYESTGVYKEMVEAFNEAGRNRLEPPDLIARAHRHRQFETRIVTNKGVAISLVTPAWQLKTPFAYRLAMGRSALPQIGGVILEARSGFLNTYPIVWNIGRPKEVVL